MPSNTVPSQGVEIWLKQATATAYQQLINVFGTVPVGAEAALEDITTLSSTVREYRKQIPDGDTLEVEVILDETNTMHLTTLRTYQSQQAPVSAAVKYPGSTTFYRLFDGLVTKYSLRASLDETLKIDTMIKITGAISTASSITTTT